MRSPLEARWQMGGGAQRGCQGQIRADVTGVSQLRGNVELIIPVVASSTSMIAIVM
jgi:hypothetical protein